MGNGLLYHGQENAKLWVEVDNVSASKDKLKFALLLGRQHDSNLLSGD